MSRAQAQAPQSHAVADERRAAAAAVPTRLSGVLA